LDEYPHPLSIVALDYHARSQYRAFLGGAADKFEEAVKANVPSKEVLESAEKAKAVVQKVGVQETKQKMNSKTGSSTPATPPVEEKTEEVTPSSTEVAEPKTPGGKRRFAKGMSLILAAGAVAVARNVVRAYLGKGLL